VIPRILFLSQANSFIATETYNTPFTVIQNYMFPSLPSILNFKSLHCHCRPMQGDCYKMSMWNTILPLEIFSITIPWLSLNFRTMANQLETYQQYTVTKMITFQHMHRNMTTIHIIYWYSLVQMFTNQTSNSLDYIPNKITGSNNHCCPFNS